MSISTRKFLSTTCLSVLALSVLTVSQPARAGFEWTPPEQTQTVPIPEPTPQAAPEDSALPMVEDMEVLDLPNRAPVVHASPEDTITEPRIKVKVLNQEPQDEPDVEDMSAPEPEVVEYQPVPKKIMTPEPVVEEEPEVDVSMPVIEEPEPEPEPYVPEVVQEENKGIKINPYPLQGDKVVDEEPETVAVEAHDPINWNQTKFEVIEGFGSDIPLAIALRQVVPPHYAFSFGEGVNAGYLVSWEGGKPWNEVLSEMLDPLQLKASIHGKVLNVGVKNAPSASISDELAEMEAEMDDSYPAEEVMDEEAPAVAEPVEMVAVEEEAPEEDAPVVVVKEEEPKKVVKAPEPILAPMPEELEEDDIVEPMEKAEVEDVVEDVKVSSGRQVILDPGSMESEQPVIEAEAEAEAVIAEQAQEMDTEEVEEALEEAIEDAEPEVKEEMAKAPMKLQPRVWEAKRGSSLRETLNSWSQEANVDLVWDASNDFELSSDVLISGTFANAVKVLFSKAVKNGPEMSIEDRNLTVMDKS